MSTNGSLVSVLVPAYRAERFLDAALESVLRQTYPSWEVVAVDDASPDGTRDLLESWARRDPRIRVFRNDRNLGMTRNWNRCLGEARGTHVVKLDADDAFRPNALELLVGPFASPGVSAVGIRTLLCTEALEPFAGLPADDAMMRADLDPFRDQEQPSETWLDIASMGHQLWHSDALMLRRDDLVAMGGYDERFGCASDTEMILRVLERPGRVAHLAAVGVLYRQVGGSVSWHFRRNGWLRWEGIVANLATLHRQRGLRRLGRRLRMRFAYLWSVWAEFRESDRFEKELPEDVRGKLLDVMKRVEAPPLGDRLFWTAREAAARRIA